MSNTLNGATLTKCFNLVSMAGKEINALYESLSNLLIAGIELSSCPISIYKGGAKDYYEMDNNEWIQTDIAWNLPLTSRARINAKAERYLSFQISLVGEGMAAINNDEPLLHMSLWDSPVDFENERMGFPIDIKNKPVLRENALIDWGTGDRKDWTKQVWTFSLRLMSLNSREDLEKYVVNPAIALLRGEDIRKSLPLDFSGLVRYQQAADGNLEVISAA
jgi:hypothetical protein